jgi:hypothetical protein
MGLPISTSYLLSLISGLNHCESNSFLDLFLDCLMDL